MNASLFALIALGLLVLPFVPLVLELLLSRDVAPLQIDNGLPVDPSRPLSGNSSATWVPHIDVDRAIFNGIVTALDIHVRNACRFRHLYGMPIVFGPAHEGPPRRDTSRLRQLSARGLLAAVQHRSSASRYLVLGDLDVPAHAMVEADFVIRGSLHIGESSLVRGNIKADSIDVGAHATVQGAMFAKHEIRLGLHSVVDGVLGVAGSLSIERAWIGKAGSAVSICAADIDIKGGACIFGQMVASRSGRFDAQTATATGSHAGSHGGL